MIGVIKHKGIDKTRKNDPTPASLESTRHPVQFASLPFLLFFLLVLSLYWLNTKHPRVQKWILLLSSYAFYTIPFYEQSGWKPLSLLLFSTSLLYSFGTLISTSNRKNKAIALGTGIALQIGILAIHKYFGFFRESTLEIIHFFGLKAHIPLLDIILPIGVSFYCFQGIAYLIDLYRGHASPVHSLLDLALYQAFFPKLLLGPICRTQDLIPQIENPRAYIPNIHHAVLLILSGVIKKVLLATLLFESGVPNAFWDPESQTTMGLWIAGFGYSAQLYCDFSGYTDMALGIALLFGYVLPPNFASPYSATNLGDFWKRWHMSFSQWLRDYIYLPLGGSWKSPLRVSLNLFLTFLFCGLWHGASWGYILWGGIHGIGLAINKRRRDAKRKRGIHPTEQTPFFAVLGWLYTMLFIMLSRIVFQAPDLELAWVYYTRMFSWHSNGEAISYSMLFLSMVAFASNFFGPILFSFLSDKIAPQEPNPRFFSVLGGSILVILCFYIIFGFMPSGIPPYLYARF